ncbi:MAG: SLBB domain-containing protein [Verrucomicrobia bacterium]|nr:SLBB domain-containing protein [Verrucomicrobiota bacterium]
MLILFTGAMLTGCGASKEAASAAKVKVNVLGEVRSPGTYAMDAPVRLHDIIAAAGGYTTAAATNMLLLTFLRPPDAFGPPPGRQVASGSEEAALKIRWDQFDTYDLAAMRQVSLVVLTQEGLKLYGLP